MKTIQERYVLRRYLEQLETHLHFKLPSVEDQTLQWFARILSETIDDSEQARFMGWVNSDKAHLYAYHHQQMLWDMLDDFAEKTEIRNERAKALVNRSV